MNHGHVNGKFALGRDGKCPCVDDLTATCVGDSDGLSGFKPGRGKRTGWDSRHGVELGIVLSNGFDVFDCGARIEDQCRDGVIEGFANDF